jgi:hypothetical protein
MNIPQLLERYGRVNRLVGDYRACVVVSDLGTTQHKDAKISLDRAMRKLATIENTLEDMGLLHYGDRHTDRGEAE